MAGLDFRVRGTLGLGVAGLGICVCLLVSGWQRLLSGVFNGDFADDVMIDVSGLPESRAHDITFSFPIGGREFEFRRFQSNLRWRMNGWVPSVRMSAKSSAIPQIKEIRIGIGRHGARFTQRDIAGWKVVNVNPLVMPVASEEIVSLEVPLPKNSPLAMINWQPDITAEEEMLASFLWLPVIAALLAGFVAASRSPRFVTMLGKAVGLSAHACCRFTDRFAFRWAAAGCLFVILCLMFVEIRQPFYFTQDDNFAQFLPVIVAGCRSAVAGVWPSWNPYQFLGAPAATLGTYALTYPFTYAAYFIARFLLSNEYLTIEVFAIGHILAGYWVTATLLRRLSVRPMLVALGASSYVLSGFTMVLGRSWYYMLPVLVWAPLLALAVEKLPASRSAWRWITGTGLVVGLFFHAGNAQMWVYGLIFFVLAIGLAWIAGQVNWRRAVWAIPAVLGGVGLSAPLLLLQMQETANILRFGGRGAPIGSGTLQMMFPLGNLLPFADVWTGFQRSLRGEMFFIGLPFVGAILFGAWAVFSMAILNRQSIVTWRVIISRNIWLLCAVVAWIFALARPGILWSITASLPVFEKFNVPVKFIGYIALFAIAGGALIIERTFAQKGRIARALPVFVFSCLFVHILLARQSFYNYAQPAYPQIPPEISRLLNTEPRGRVLTIGPDRSVDGSYFWSLRNNFATAAQVPVVEGYDPLVDTRPEDRKLERNLDAAPARIARALGVRWILVWRPGFEWHFGSDPNAWALEITTPSEQHRYFALQRNLKLRAEFPDVSIYELDGASPLAFSSASPDIGLPVRFDWSGATVDTTGTAGSFVTLNVMGRPWMKITAGGAPVEWKTDEFGRIRFLAPRGPSVVQLAYSPPWQKAGLFGVALILGSLSITAMLNANWPARKRIPSIQTEPAHARA